jgi:hypothetical protein
MGKANEIESSAENETMVALVHKPKIIDKKK